DPIECIQSLLSHPLFRSHITFIPRKVWSTTAQLSCMYDEWLMGKHTWDLQASLSPLDLSIFSYVNFLRHYIHSELPGM
ncbi:hypothetical protein EDC04DRAFT_2588265, partial [Pisolithus marmoratus]